MKYKTNSSSSPRRKRLIIALVIVALLVLAVGGYALWKKRYNRPKGPDPVGTITGVNYNPPTENEKKETEENKKAVEGRAELEKQTQPAGQKRSVSVTISSLQQNGSNIEVYSYASGVSEEGGTCTATFTKGSETLTKTSTGVQDASTTVCTPIRFPGTELSKGGWSVTMVYESANAKGQSNPVTLEVK